MKALLWVLLSASLLCAGTPPALNFTNNTSDRVDIGSGTTIDDLTTFTILVWCFPTANSAAPRKLWQKGTIAGGGGYRLLQVLNTSGAIEGELDRATGDIQIDTNNSSLTTGAWQFYAFVADINGVNTAQHIYGGSQTAVLSEFGYAVRSAGSGAAVTDNTQNGIIGNNSGNASAFQGYIAYAAVYNIALTSAQIENQRHHPHRTMNDGCVEMTWLGLSGTGNQLDLSGNGNDGTVTGATQIDGPPNVLLPWVTGRKRAL